MKDEICDATVIKIKELPDHWSKGVYIVNRWELLAFNEIDC